MAAEAEPKQEINLEESENKDSAPEQQINSESKVEESAPAGSSEPDKEASIEEELTNKEAPKEEETADKNIISESIPTEEAPKDRVLFLSEDDAKIPSKITLPEPSEEDGPHGPIFPNGEINWNCPCFGDMAVGPCGVEFRAAFSCFHHSTADPKGSDCIDKFADMQICMSGHPELFDKKEREGGEEEAEINPSASENVAADSKVEAPVEEAAKSTENEAEKPSEVVEVKAAESEESLPSENLDSKASS